MTATRYYNGNKKRVNTHNFYGGAVRDREKTLS